MSEPEYFQGRTRSSEIRNWILSEMLRGAGKSALVLVVIGFAIYAIYLVSFLLPEESKQAPDPMNVELEQPLIRLT